MIAVSGATGALGGRVAARLADRGLAQRLVVRDAARAPRLEGAEVAVVAGYHDRSAMTDALRGADAFLFVSARETADRVTEQHIRSTGLCEAAGRPVSDAVPRLTGHPAQSLREYLSAHPDSYSHLTKEHHQWT